jgi:hypothetical protein
MVEDFLLDMEDSSGPMWLQAWRCMNCGNVAESVLQRNRETHGMNVTTAAQPTIKERIPLSVETLNHLAA